MAIDFLVPLKQWGNILQLIFHSHYNHNGEFFLYMSLDDRNWLLTKYIIIFVEIHHTCASQWSRTKLKKKSNSTKWSRRWWKKIKNVQTFFLSGVSAHLIHFRYVINSKHEFYVIGKILGLCVTVLNMWFFVFSCDTCSYNCQNSKVTLNELIKHYRWKSVTFSLIYPHIFLESTILSLTK